VGFAAGTGAGLRRVGVGERRPAGQRRADTERDGARAKPGGCLGVALVGAAAGLLHLSLGLRPVRRAVLASHCRSYTFVSHVMPRRLTTVSSCGAHRIATAKPIRCGREIVGSRPPVFAGASSELPVFPAAPLCLRLRQRVRGFATKHAGKFICSVDADTIDTRARQLRIGAGARRSPQAQMPRRLSTRAVLGPARQPRITVHRCPGCRLGSPWRPGLPLSARIYRPLHILRAPAAGGWPQSTAR
jgi:hypothetical protein